MYLRRLQLVHYGPINNLDIKLFPKDDKPKPLVLVGGNGSGKEHRVVTHCKRNHRSEKRNIPRK